MLHWIVERERIRVRRERGKPQPWTKDPVLANYRFCNVRREDDSVTRWIAANIREPYADHSSLWFMLCVARWINWPDTLQGLMDGGLWWPNFTCARMGAFLEEQLIRGEKVFGAAYKIPAPREKGATKGTFVAHTLRAVRRDRKDWARYFEGTPTLQGTHDRLVGYGGWGTFMAYQAVVDMRFTRVLRDARDVDTWCAAGPGTIRGLNRLAGRPTDCAIDPHTALREMRRLYKIIEPETGVHIDLSDVPNILCETDKYLRTLNGEGRPKVRYTPALVRPGFL
jgi:hypothetical protein